MRTSRKIMLLFGLTALVIAPLSVLITYLLAPLWRWIEASTGIDALGERGPALWCFVLVFVVQAAFGAAAVLREARRDAAAGRPAAP